MKKILLVLMLFISIFAYSCGATTVTDKAILLVYNNSVINTDVPPTIVNSRCLVPARALFESIGAEVAWVSDLNRVDVSLGGQKISLTIGKKSALVDGTKIALDAPASIIGGRTMIPVRFISESFGMSVAWKDMPPTVEITNGEKPGVLKDITNSVDKGNLKTSFKLSAAYSKYSAYYLQNPFRLVIDLYGVEMGVNAPDLLNVNGVNSLRIGQHDGFVRIVYDTDGRLNYNITQNADKTEIKVNIVLTAIIPDSTKGITVAIDVGHGGADPGAVGMLDGEKVREKDINLDIGLKLKKLLEDNGYKVFMTRETDVAVNLRSRPDLCSAANADMMISIHNNAISNVDISGLMTFYVPNTGEESISGLSSKQLAEFIQEETQAKTNANDMGARDGGEYIVLKYSEIPAVIVECGFLTNKDEIRKLNTSEYRLLIAEGIFNGIKRAKKIER